MRRRVIRARTRIRAVVALVALVTLVALLGPHGLHAQTADNRASPVFLERSYIFSRAPVDSLTFEAHLAPHLFLYQREYQTGELYDRPTHGGALTFTPMVRLRMYSSASFPVRTPSYIPRPLVAQLFRAALTDPPAGLDSPVGLWGLTWIPWAHHSNGQDGCLYLDQSDIGGECVDDPYVVHDVHGSEPGARREVNRDDGSFSTNYTRLTAHYRHIRTGAFDRFMEMTGHCTFEAGVEWHPDSFGPGDISPAQAALYPQLRVHGGVELTRITARDRWLAGRTSLAASAEYLDGTAAGVPHMRYQVELSHTRSRTGWGLFVRYFDGMDYYNLAFLDHRRWLQAGISFDFFRADEFSLPVDGPVRARADYPAGLLDALAQPLDRVCGWVL